MKINKIELNKGQYTAYLDNNTLYSLDYEEMNYLLSETRQTKKGKIINTVIFDENNKLIVKTNKQGKKQFKEDDKIIFYEDEFNKIPNNFYNFSKSKSRTINPFHIKLSINNKGIPYIMIAEDYYAWHNGIILREAKIKENKLSIDRNYVDLINIKIKISEETFNYYMNNYGITNGIIDNEVFPLIDENKNIVFFNREHKIWKQAFKNNRVYKKDMKPGDIYIYDNNLYTYICDYKMDKNSHIYQLYKYYNITKVDINNEKYEHNIFNRIYDITSLEKIDYIENIDEFKEINNEDEKIEFFKIFLKYNKNYMIV